MAGNLFGTSKKTIKEEIQSLSRRINDNKEFQRVELPALQEIKTINDISHVTVSRQQKEASLILAKNLTDRSIKNKLVVNWPMNVQSILKLQKRPKSH